MSNVQQQPFMIASYADPTHQYELTSVEAFQQIYEPQGFYIVGGRAGAAVQDRIKYLEDQRAALASKVESDANTSVELPDETDASDAKPSNAGSRNRTKTNKNAE